jgi:hypothetical protein
MAIPKAAIDVDGNGIGMVNDLLQYRRNADDSGRFCIWIGRVPLWINGERHYCPYSFRFSSGDKMKGYEPQEVLWDPEKQVMSDVVLPLHKKASGWEGQ